jgi:multidrug efflux system membrane fusion protein
MPYHHTSTPSRFPRWAIILAVVLVLGFAAHRLFLSGKEERTRPTMAPAPVRVAAAAIADVPHYLEGIGTVVPSSDVLVTSRVAGQLLKLHFTEGQRVAQGDLLAEIDPRPFQADLDQAKGALARDAAQLENARRDLARYRDLAGKKYIAGQEYETQMALVRQLQGTIEADKAAVDSAALQLEYSRILAPCGGRLGLKQVDEGNQIKTPDTTGIVRITESKPCDVIFTLPQTHTPLVTAALSLRERDPDAAPLEVQALDQQATGVLDTGELISVDNQIDTSTGTIKLKARFPNADNQLFPNQFVNARLLVRTLKGVVTVPAAAIQLGAKGSYVYVVSGEGRQAKVAFRLVTTGISANDATVIDKGLAGGERVVVDGVDRLRDGMPVTVHGDDRASR